MIAAVRVRGLPDTPRNAAETLEQLGLDRKHSCVLVEDEPSREGMLRAVKDYVAYGEVDDDTVEALQDRGDGPYRLSPPSKGFRDQSTGSGQGGSLGKRDDMDDLVQRML